MEVTWAKYNESVTRRVWELLEGFNRSGNHRRVEHGPDGRYRQSRG
jgi:hypothetical protein